MTISTTLKQRLPLIVAVIVGLAVIIGGTFWWLGNQRWETTDNAFVQADTTIVSPQISGYVVEVLVRDNQRVEPGQILVRLDDADARARLAEAEANLQALIAAIGNVDARAAQEQAMIASRAAGVAQARAQAGLADSQVNRYGKLAEQGWVSQQRIQTEQAGAATARAAVAEAQAALVAEQRTAAVLGSTREQSVAAAEQARRAAVARGQAQLARIAELEAQIEQVRTSNAAIASANSKFEEAIAAAQALLDALNAEQQKYANTAADGELLVPLEKARIAELESRKDSLKREAQALNQQ